VAVSEMRNAVWTAISSSMRERGASPDDCDRPKGTLIGDFTIEFEAEIRATRNEVLVDVWRLVAVRDGSPLAPDAVTCFEAMLGGPYVVNRPASAPPFVEYEGPYPLVYRAHFEGSDGAP